MSAPKPSPRSPEHCPPRRPAPAGARARRIGPGYRGDGAGYGGYGLRPAAPARVGRVRPGYAGSGPRPVNKPRDRRVRPRLAVRPAFGGSCGYGTRPAARARFAGSGLRPAAPARVQRARHGVWRARPATTGPARVQRVRPGYGGSGRGPAARAVFNRILTTSPSWEAAAAAADGRARRLRPSLSGPGGRDERLGRRPFPDPTAAAVSGRLGPLRRGAVDAPRISARRGVRPCRAGGPPPPSRRGARPR